jgi:3-oxoacyl-[acyl-carrier-protein] synthase-3
MTDAYITNLGSFLPGIPINNKEMENYLGLIDEKPSSIKEKILNQNGIQFRYYALDKNQNKTITNQEMATEAIKKAISRSGITLNDISLLCAATSMGDIILPGFASMVHGQLGNPPCEIATLHGFCASSIMALKHAFSSIISNENSNAVVCASEFTSRLFKSSHFNDSKKISFDTEFLRWMLSDGAGAAVIENKPNGNPISLKINWITLKSYANIYETCMYLGLKGNGPNSKNLFDYPNLSQAGEMLSLVEI